MRLLVKFKRLHKWFALLVGIQLILWIVSGIAFSFIDPDQINGDFIFAKINRPITAIIDFQKLLKQYPLASNIKQFNLHERNVVHLTTEGKSLLLDADNMELVSVDRSLISRIAEASYQGGGVVKAIQLETNKTADNRKFALPIWKATFEDQYATALYFSSSTGLYEGIRTNSWRLNDFFLMLHFMDYGQRDDFNHFLIIFAAVVLVLFSTSGMLLVYSSFSKQDFVKLVNRVFWREQITLNVVYKSGEKRTFKVGKSELLLDLLNANNIELDNICGGGGICGGCRVKLISTTNNKSTASYSSLDNLAEQDTLSKSELKQGYRLACQLSVKSNIDILIPIEIEKI